MGPVKVIAIAGDAGVRGAQSFMDTERFQQTQAGTDDAGGGGGPAVSIEDNLRQATGLGSDNRPTNCQRIT